MATQSHNTPPGVNDTGLPAVPIDIAAVIAHLAMRPQEAEIFVAGLADALIEAKDALEPDADLEPSFGYLPNGAVLDECEADPDGEPMLGAPEVEFRFGEYGGPPVARGHINQEHWADGHTDAQFDDVDREAVDEDGGDINDEAQDEVTQDLEPDEADCEPTLGAVEGIMDQRSWSAHDGSGSEEMELSLGAP